MSGATLWARSEIRRGWWSLLMVALLVAIAGGAVTAGVAGARRGGIVGGSLCRRVVAVERTDLPRASPDASLDPTSTRTAVTGR